MSWVYATRTDFVTFTYPSAGNPRPHAVTGVGSYTQSYDANGNMTGRENATGTQTLTFDAENRLSQVQGTGGGYTRTSTYVYDGNGQRIKKTEGGSTTIYVNQYYEKDITADVATSHYYLGGKQVALKKGSTLEYLHQDHLNSSSLSTDSSGNQVFAMKVFSFGDARSSSGTLGTDKKYTGQRLDGTGLYFYENRYYDATLGKFISPDQFVQNGPGFDLVSSALTVNLAKTGFETYPQAIGSAPLDPQTLNRYSYVLNNPLRYIDPYGWWTWGWGINIQVTGFGFAFSASVSVVVSGGGEVGIAWSGGGGGGAGANPKADMNNPAVNKMVSGSVTYQGMYTTAESIAELRGATVYTGGSIGSEGGVVGLEGLAGETYQGFAFQVGVGTPGFEMHGIVEYGGVMVLVEAPGSTPPAAPISDTYYYDPYSSPYYDRDADPWNW